jgi:methionyl aminopeptidase
VTDAAVVHAHPPLRRSRSIRLHGPEAFAGMRKAGRLTAEALDMLVPHVRPGVTTAAIDQLVFEFGMAHGALPATLGYRGYTHSCCTSINEVVCHGIPNDMPLKDGDIVNIDVTLIVDGWHGDASRMYGVGTISPEARRLCDITFECLNRAIKKVRPAGRGLKAVGSDATFGRLGHVIQKYAESEGCSVVESFCGHGIGQLFHDEPSVMHFGKPKDGPLLKAGMIFTIEPMINLGGYDVEVLADGWTAVTLDRSLSAQYEHTVGVTETGCEIFTLSPVGLDNPLAAQ